MRFQNTSGSSKMRAEGISSLVGGPSGKPFRPERQSRAGAGRAGDAHRPGAPGARRQAAPVQHEPPASPRCARGPVCGRARATAAESIAPVRPGAGPVTARRRCAPRPRWMVGSVDVGSWSGVVGHIEFEFGERSCQWRFGDIAVGLRMVGVRGVDRGVEPSVGVIASAVAYSGDVEQLVDCRYEYDDG